MAQCRDLETHHHEKLLEISINTLEKIVKGELDEDLPEDVRAVSVVGWGWEHGWEWWAQWVLEPGRHSPAKLCRSSKP